MATLNIRPHLSYQFAGVLNDIVLSYAFFAFEDGSSSMNSFLYSLSLSWIPCSSGEHPTWWCHEEASVGHAASILLWESAALLSVLLHRTPVLFSQQASRLALSFLGPPTLITDICNLSVFYSLWNKLTKNPLGGWYHRNRDLSLR